MTRRTFDRGVSVCLASILPKKNDHGRQEIAKEMDLAATKDEH